MSSNDIYYVYIYKDPSRNFEPFYIGKGHGTRSHGHLTRKDRHPLTRRIQKMLREGIIPIIDIIQQPSEKEAFLAEINLISKFGRKDLNLGTLLNLTDGGEGPSGVIRSEEYKLKVSNSRKLNPIDQRGIKNHRYGTHHSSEWKKHMSEIMIGDNNPAKRPEVREKQSQIRKANPTLPQGLNHPSLGTHPSEEVKIKMVENRKQNLTQKICQYCGKEINSASFKQFHGENCFKNPNLDPILKLKRSELAKARRSNR
jgi:hypothetical protein